MNQMHRHTSITANGARKLLFAGVAVAALMAFSVAPATAAEGDPAWQPRASERLVKLPASYLQKSIEADFSQSELGAALRDIDTEIGFKTLTLGDLQGAIAQAEGEVRTELRHQFLAEKRAYLDLVARKGELRRRHLETQQRLFEQLLKRLGRDAAGLTPARIELMDRQEAARQRFQASLDAVDLKVFGESAIPESRYAREYAKNLAAVETLMRAIVEHPATAEPMIDGRAVTKEDYIRQMLADNDAALALLDQEENILGYMAKLVALDATALSEQVMDAQLAESDVPEASGITEAVGFFVSR